MTVKELIARLQTYNENYKVFVETDNGPSEVVDYFETDRRESEVEDTLYLHIAEQE